MNVVDYITATYIRGGKQRGYWQTAYFYLASDPSLIEYIGIAERGALTSEASWVVFKLIYNSNNNLSAVQTSVEGSILDNRASLTYA